MPRARPPLLAALFLAPLGLRPQLTAVGPLLPQIQRSLHLSHAEAGLLGTIPVLCMGLFALPTPSLVRRFGTRAVFGGSLAAVSLATIVRAFAPGTWSILVLTFLFGIAAGVGGAVLPTIVKERFAERPAFGTGTYSVGINLGAAGAAAVAVPLADAIGGWRPALGVLGASVATLAIVWVTLTRGRLPEREPALALPRLPFRSGVAWTLALLFGLQATCFHGLSIWLADAFVERGWNTPSAGALVATFQFASIPATLLVSWAADRLLDRRTYLLVSSSALTVAVVGLNLSSGASAWGWAVLGGAACGSLFPLALTLSVDAAAESHEAGAVAALMLGGGYSIAALAPLVLGLVRDAAGGFSTAFWLLALVALALVATCFVLSPTRLRRITASHSHVEEASETA